MEKKNILIVGYGSLLFLNNTIKHLKANNSSLTFDLLLTNTFVDSKYLNNYNKVFKSFSNNIFTKIPIVRKLYIRFSILLALFRLKNKYDFVHIHFLDSNLGFYKIFKQIGTIFIISIWGTDFYRSTGCDLKWKIKLLRTADYITFTNEQTKIDLNNKIDKLKAELKICRFGLEAFELFKERNFTKEKSREKLNIPLDKTIITIGYNASSTQQHMKILEQIIKLKDNLYYKNLFLVIPFTYGNVENQYKINLIRYLNKTQVEYKMFETFLSEEDNAQLRNSSDIMVQLQPTDQFSGSMQEYMYCGDIIITGSWLPYNTFKEYGVYYHTINEIPELSIKLNEVLTNLKEEKAKTVNNKELIYNISSWEKNINSWSELYD